MLTYIVISCDANQKLSKIVDVVCKSSTCIDVYVQHATRKWYIGQGRCERTSMMLVVNLLKNLLNKQPVFLETLHITVSS